MALENIHNIYAGQIVKPTPDDPVMIRLTEHGIALNPEIMSVPDSGELYPRCLYLASQQPDASLSTPDLDVFLSEIGSLGLSFDLDSETTAEQYAFDLFGQKRALGVSKASGSVHQQYRIRKGVIVPRQLTVDQKTCALTLSIIPIQSGTNLPVGITDSQALPTLPDAPSEYSLGPIYLNDGLVTGVDRLVLDFGISLDIDYDGSETFPSYVSGASIIPTIRVTGKNIMWVADTTPASPSPRIGQTGFTMSHTLGKSQFFLRKRECGGRFVDDATTEHLRLTMGGLIVPENILTGQKVGASLFGKGAFDGTNLPINIATGVAITAPA